MSLAKTYLQDLRVKYPSNLDRDELRRTRTGLLTSALEMTQSPKSIISDDFKQRAKVSQGRNLDVPVMTKGAVTIKNARSCDVACTQSESDMVRVVWKTAVVDVCMVPSQYDKNEIGYLADLNKKLRDRTEALAMMIENDIDTALDTGKSQVYHSPYVGSKYNFAGNQIEVALAQQELFVGDIDPINFADDFMDEDVYILASPTLMSQARHYINQGKANDENLSWQFNGKHFAFSNRIANVDNATGYFMPDGSIGFLTRVDIDARMRSKSTSGTEWFEDTIPGIPFPVGVKYDSQCSDQSALETAGLSHLKATLVEHWQFSFDYAIVLPYTSDIATKPVAIRKFVFKNA